MATVTTWEQRFVSVIKLFCRGRTPPDDLVKGWLANDGRDELQNWIGMNLSQKVQWVQCIEVLDAASNLADTPEEGYGHLKKNGESG